MPKLDKKPYRLMTGTHRVPNPSFDQKSDDPETSHVLAQEGDIVYLTDDQYKSFKDKFRPTESEGTEIKDGDEAEFTAAKLKAAATGEMVNPNAKPPTAKPS